MSDNRVRTGKGLINDIKTNLLKICKQAFETEPLVYFDGPQELKKVSPDHVNIQNLPALFVWCDGFKPSSPALGQQYERRTTEKLEFHCNIQYIVPLIDSEEAEEELDEIGWYLFEHVDANKNLNGIVKTETVVPEVTTVPLLKMVGSQVQPVSNCKIKLVFTVLRKKQQATGGKAAKYK